MRCLPLLLLVSVASAADTTLARTNTELRAAMGEARAAHLVADIPGLYLAAPEKDRKEALKLVGKAARSKDLRIRHAAFRALGEMRVKGSSKYLRRWLNLARRATPKVSHLEAMEAAGRIADTVTLALMRKQADHKNLDFAAAASRALGGFNTLPTKRRKSLAFDLVERIEKLKYASGGGGRLGGGLSGTVGGRGRGVRDEVVQRKTRLAIATIRALQELTGKKYTTLAAWQGWRDRAKKQADPF